MRGYFKGATSVRIIIGQTKEGNAGVSFVELPFTLINGEAGSKQRCDFENIRRYDFVTRIVLLKDMSQALRLLMASLGAASFVTAGLQRHSCSRISVSQHSIT